METKKSDCSLTDALQSLSCLSKLIHSKSFVLRFDEVATLIIGASCKGIKCILLRFMLSSQPDRPQQFS